MPATARNRAGVRPDTRDPVADAALVALLAVPVVVIPGGLDRFQFGKLVLAALGAGLALLAFRPAGRLSRSTRWLLAGGAVVLAIAALLAHSPWAAFAGRADRYEGAFVLATYLLAGVSGARLLGPARSARTQQLAATTIAAVSLVVAAFAVAEAMGFRPLASDLARPGGLLGDASDEGALAVLYALPLAGWSTTSAGRRRVFMTVGAVAAAATVVLSASRGAILGLLIGLLVLAAVAIRRARVPLLGATAAVAVGALALPFTRRRILGQTGLAEHTVTGRALLWRESLALIGHHPLLGIGPSNFQTAILTQHDRRWQSTVGPANPPGSPHDVVLQVLTAGGILLLATVAGVVVVFVARILPAVRTRDMWVCPCAAGLLAYVVALLFHLTSPGTTIPAAVLAGGLLAVDPTTHVRSRRAAIEQGLGVALCAILTITFLLASFAEIELRRATVSVAHGQLATAQSEFVTARDLRPWDVDLPGQALHEFATVADVGHTDAIAYGRYWARRVGPIEDDEQVILDRAALLEAGGQFEAAIHLLTAQLRTDHDNPLLLLRRGVLHGELKQWAAARSDLLQSARISTSSPEPWRDLVIVYNALGDRQSARDAARRAAQLSR